MEVVYFEIRDYYYWKCNDDFLTATPTIKFAILGLETKKIQTIQFKLPKTRKT